MLVVDASVVVKVLVPEAGSAAAVEMLASSPSLFIPSDGFAEVCEVIARKLRLERLARTVASSRASPTTTCPDC